MYELVTPIPLLFKYYIISPYKVRWIYCDEADALWFLLHGQLVS